MSKRLEIKMAETQKKITRDYRQTKRKDNIKTATLQQQGSLHQLHGPSTADNNTQLQLLREFDLDVKYGPCIGTVTCILLHAIQCVCV